jgi:pyrroline-5-carboxylate reductase
MRITFIGGGNMAAALIGGLVERDFDPAAIAVVDLLPEIREGLRARFGVNCFGKLARLPSLGDVVVLAVKPQQLHIVAAELAPRLSTELVLSVAAGIRLDDLRRWLGGHAALARCMPNTPALIGQGISGLYAAPAVPAAQREGAQRILEAVGEVVWVEEEQALDAVTAVSGSGPAYVFYMIEAMQRAAGELGLDAAAARQLALVTVRGAAELARRSEEPVAQLRERVTSKGGTTERALATLAQRDVAGGLVAAIHAAAARAAELGDELGSR